MNAIDYFKKYGLKGSIEHLDWMVRVGARRDIHGWFMDDLKRLIESHELVEMHGSTKGFFIANYCQEHRLAPHQSDVYSFVASKFDKAIIDVESCQ